MLTNRFLTARMPLSVFFLAVFFSNSAFAVDRPLSNLESGMTDLVYDLSRSIVTVESYRRVAMANGPGGSSESIQTTISSGIVCDSQGSILMLAPNAVGQDRLVIDFESQSIPAKIVAVDYFTDLALVTVGQPIGEPVRYSDKQVCAGQMIVALGNAYGLRASPAMGFCAGLRTDGNLQFSVPVASSSVGGGVFDLSGALIGIITGTLGQESRVALAVPAYQVPSIVASLRTHGDRQAGYIGVTTTDIEITPPMEISSPFTLASAGSSAPNTIDQGILVTSIVPGSPADLGGLQKGDLILAVNGRRINSALELSGMVRQTNPGVVFDLSFVRHGAMNSARVEIGPRSYFRLQPLIDTGTPDEAVQPKIDSLNQMLNYLKSEIGHLEDRMRHLK